MRSHQLEQSPLRSMPCGSGQSRVLRLWMWRQVTSQQPQASGLAELRPSLEPARGSGLKAQQWHREEGTTKLEPPRPWGLAWVCQSPHNPQDWRPRSLGSSQRTPLCSLIFVCVCVIYVCMHSHVYRHICAQVPFHVCMSMCRPIGDVSSLLY